MIDIGDEQSVAHVRLCRSQGIGPITFRRLIGRYGDAQSAVLHIEENSKNGAKADKIHLAPRDTILRELERSESLGAQIVLSTEQSFPSALALLPDAPPILSCLGDLSLLERPTIAIVGARNASANGLKLAAMLSHDLGEAGYAIVSGLARGTDGAAHKSALKTGTIAVLAGGVDQIYPNEHTALYHDIAANGLIVSEQPLGKTAKARDFPKRNRIVSGLARAVVVVEAAERSGTLITARLATEQGRDVCAIPGSPLDPRADGTNKLIREGAILVRHADDVLEVLNTFSASNRSPQGSMFDEGDQEVFSKGSIELRDQTLSLLSVHPTHRDELARLTGMPLSQLSDVLLDLVLDGQASEISAGSFVSVHDASNRSST